MKGSNELRDSHEELQNQFRLERYKHILENQKQLNEYSHRFLTVFYSSIAAVAIAGVSVFMSWKKLEIDAALARTVIRGLEVTVFLSGVFVLLVVLSNILSWWDSRVDECKVVDEVLGPGYRKPPSIRSAYRWFELWVVLLVVAVVVGLVVYIERIVIPMIR